MLSVKHTTAQWDRLYRGMCWIWIRKSFMPSKNKTFLEVSMYTCSSGFQTTTIPFPVNIYKWQRLSGMLNILQDKTQPWFARRGGSLCECIRCKAAAVPSVRGTQAIHPGRAEGGHWRLQLSHADKRGLWQCVFFLFFFFPELQFPTTYLDVSNDSCNHVLNLALYP